MSSSPRDHRHYMTNSTGKQLTSDSSAANEGACTMLRTPHRLRALVVAEQPTPPFWGGSEKFWYEALLHDDLRTALSTHVLVHRSAVTERRAATLRYHGIAVDWYPVWDAASQRSLRGRSHRAIRRAVKPFYRGLGLEVGSARLVWWRRTLQVLRPDVVWFNLSGAGAVFGIEPGAQACGQLDIPYVIVYQHAPEEMFLDTEDEVARYSRIVAAADAAFFVARRNRDAIEHSVGHALMNARYTRNALAHQWLSTARPLRTGRHGVSPDETLRFINVARLDLGYKGQHLLLQALASGPWPSRNWSLALVGAGPHARLIEGLVGYYGIDRERVNVFATEDVLAVLADAHVFVMPSLSEGTPFALLEAMATGLPAVATPVGGIPEAIHEGETGWLAHSPRAEHFGEALERCWEHRDRLDEFGQRAARLIEDEFCQDGVMPVFTNDLISVVTSRRAGGQQTPATDEISSPRHPAQPPSRGSH